MAFNNATCTGTLLPAALVVARFRRKTRQERPMEVSR